MPLGAFCIIHLRKKDPLGASSPHLLIMMNGRFFVNRERYSDFKLEIVCHHFTFIYDTSRKWAVHNGDFKYGKTVSIEWKLIKNNCQMKFGNIWIFKNLIDQLANYFVNKSICHSSVIQFVYSNFHKFAVREINRLLTN